jgi:hypothetical protein
MKKYTLFLEKLEKSRDFWFAVVITLVFVLLRIPSLSEPEWYGDEGIYQVVGMALAQGRLLYQEIWDNKPPLLYVLYALFNGDLFSLKFLSLVFGAFSVVVFFLLAKQLFKDKRAIIASSVFFALLFGLPILEGNIANAENFMILPILIAAFLVFTAKKEKQIFLAGILLSLAALIKVVAIFDFAAFFIFLLVLRFYPVKTLKTFGTQIKQSLRKPLVEFRNELVFLKAFILPILLVALYFLLKGIFPSFWTAVVSQNVGYVSYGNALLLPMGFLLIKLLLLLIATIAIVVYKNRIGIGGVFIYLWLVFSLFNAFFSQRPYTHYLLILLPSFSLFLGFVLENRRLYVFNATTLVIILLLILLNFRFGKTLSYYANYIGFVTNKINTPSYQAFFDRSTPRDYELAGFIREKTAKEDSIFLWSDSAQIYAMSGKLPPGRFAVSYHITFYKDAVQETQNALEKSKPKFIIVTKDGIPQDFLIGYTLKYNLRNAKVYARENF